MSERLTDGQKQLLKHIQDGGLVAVAVHGKKSLTMEVFSSPYCFDAGLMRIEQLRDLGLVRDGDPSPYKTGRITPIVLTEKARTTEKAS